MIIGASNDPSKFGCKACRAYMRQGHDVVPVNPNAAEVLGLKCWPEVSGPKGPFDRALVYVPGRVMLGILPALAARGDVAELWLNPGADDPEVVAAAEKLGFNVVQACAIVDIGERP